VIAGVRHAEVWNPDGVVYARLPGFHLSAEGRGQAAALGKALAKAPVVAVHASPLDRAVETATLLAEPHGLAVVSDERLLEWSFWVGWEGMPWTRIRERHPELLEQYAADPENASPHDPLLEAGRRVLEWAAEAREAHPEGLVVGVSHEAPLIAAMLADQHGAVGAYHTVRLPHLGAVRLRPGRAEPVDLVAWAQAC
jgi:broad specificity phosphatase PhoE